MKIIFALISIFSQASSLHGEHSHHGAEMKASSPVSGSSIAQLGSKWKNQKGESFKMLDLRGKPRLVVMIFTRCETACPLIVEDLKEIAQEIEVKHSAKLDVSLFSLDSFRETPESLAAFSAKRKLPPHWQLLTTSDAGAVAELAATLGVKYKRLPDGNFIHSNTIYFLNREGEVVTQKDGIKSAREEFMKRIRKNL